MGGCAGAATQLPETTELLDKLPRVENSTKSSCWQQRQIAAQNSYVDSIKAKKSIVYKPPCEVDPKPTEAESKPTT